MQVVQPRKPSSSGQVRSLSGFLFRPNRWLTLHALQHRHLRVNNLLPLAGKFDG